MRSWLEQPVLLLFLSESSSLRREHSASQISAFSGRHFPSVAFTVDAVGQVT